MTRPHKPTPPAHPGVYDRRATGTREYWTLATIGSGLTLSAMVSQHALEQRIHHENLKDEKPFGTYPDIA